MLSLQSVLRISRYQNLVSTSIPFSVLLTFKILSSCETEAEEAVNINSTKLILWRSYHVHHTLALLRPCGHPDQASSRLTRIVCFCDKESKASNGWMCNLALR
jgi:hypothetical protein